MGQEERIGAAYVSIGWIVGQQLGEEGGGWLPVAHQAMSDDCRVNGANFAQCPRHELLRHTHAENAADELVPDEPLALVELVPGEDHGGPLIVFGLAAQRE
jgi:hypothetical protein